VTVPALTRPSDIEERFVAPDGEEAPPAGRSAVQWLGELCHRALERWDFAGGADQAGRVVAEVAEGMGARARVPAAMARRAAEMLEAFAATDAAGELARAEILGREVPMLARVGDRVVSARADILFRLDGRLVVGDYKLAKYPKVAPEAAAAYEAVAAAALGEKAVFATISLGLGEIAYNPAGGGR
jgi:ATP-dependent exoDNAse (exonuclease V) beta subunit